MKYITIIAVIFAVALTACGGASTAKFATNKEAKQDLKMGETIVKSCVSKGNLATHAGRQKILSCIAPPGHKVAFENCASKAVTSDLPFHRKRLPKDLAICVERNR